MQQEYESMSLAQKIGASLAGNTAMAYGMQLMLMHEGTGAGIFQKYINLYDNSKFGNYRHTME